MNLLISGGFGFIGGYLLPYLLGKDVHVGLIARRVPATFQEIAKRVDLHIHDLSEPASLRLSRQYDAYIDLAGAPHSVASASGDPISRTLAVTRHCLDVCRANYIPRFIYCSTFQVYGRDHGFVDENTPVVCRNDYARAHHLSEEMVREAHREGGLDYAILRPTNGYGFSPFTDVHRWSLVPSCFCRTAVEQQEIVLQTSGHQQKDFIHLEHVASLIYGICASFDRFKNQPINLASGSSQAIIDVARLVQEVYGRTVGGSSALRVLSDDPLPAEPLVVSAAKTAGLPYTPSGDRSLAGEIAKTLAFLTSGHRPSLAQHI